MKKQKNSSKRAQIKKVIGNVITGEEVASKDSKISDKRYVGQKGELVAEKYLLKQGHTIVAKNYRTKYGEIDLITKKAGKLHFVEVKTSLHVLDDGLGVIRDDSGAVYGDRAMFNRESLHQHKIKRVMRLAERYRLENGVGDEIDSQVDGIFIDFFCPKDFIKKLRDKMSTVKSKSMFRIKAQYVPHIEQMV